MHSYTILTLYYSNHPVHESQSPHPAPDGARGAAHQPNRAVSPAPAHIALAVLQPPRAALSKVRPEARARVARDRRRRLLRHGLQHDRAHVRDHDRVRRARHGLRARDAVRRAHALQPARREGLWEALWRDERRAGHEVRPLSPSPSGRVADGEMMHGGNPARRCLARSCTG